MDNVPEGLNIVVHRENHDARGGKHGKNTKKMINSEIYIALCGEICRGEQEI